MTTRVRFAPSPTGKLHVGNIRTALMNWLVARGALTGSVSKVHSNYHVPISNTATGLLVLENRA